MALIIKVEYQECIKGTGFDIAGVKCEVPMLKAVLAFR